MLKKDYEEMTKALVEFLRWQNKRNTGWVPTQQAIDEVLGPLQSLLESYGVEVTA